MIQRFQMTNAPDSDTEVSFHGRAGTRSQGAALTEPARRLATRDAQNSGVCLEVRVT